METVQRGEREPAGRQQKAIITQLNIPLCTQERDNYCHTYSSVFQPLLAVVSALLVSILTSVALQCEGKHCCPYLLSVFNVLQ